jgi:hypothetical protein
MGGAVEESKRGRPKKFIDLDLVRKLAQIQCTHAEIAATLDLSVDTLTRNEDFAEVYKRGADAGKKSLRRMQFESAAKGNATMQIWLGKQYLHQTDRNLHEITLRRSLADYSTEELEAMVQEARLNGILPKTIEAMAEQVTSDFPPSNESEKQEVPSGGFSETVLDIEPEEASGPGPDWPEDA